MTDKNLLKYCLSEVEKKLNWEASGFWKDRDFIKLSEIISEASNISISAHTLKRLFGKIKYAKSYNPQHATKDALAIFLDYKDWHDFKSVQKNTIKANSQNSDEKKAKISRKRFLKTALIIASLSIVVLLFFWVDSNQKNIENSDFTFNIKDSIGITPYTISIDYDVSNIKSDSIKVDYNFINPNRGPRVAELSKLKFANNFTYQIPGYYPLELKVDNDVITTKNILAMSDGWDSYVLPENDTQTFWIKNELEFGTKNDKLYYSPEDLKANGFNNTVFYIANRLFKQFEIDGDNFEMKVRFKNSEDIGGITCYNFHLKLTCTNESNYFSLMEDGCSLFSRLKIGDKFIDGKDNDLSSFKINTQDWNIFYVLVENKKAKVYINDALIYKDAYTVSNGKIVGIENIFKGCGMLDYIEIKDLKTRKVFFDDFTSANRNMP